MPAGTCPADERSVDGPLMGAVLQSQQVIAPECSKIGLVLLGARTRAIVACFFPYC